MRKLAILALVLTALGLGYFYISNSYSSTPIEAVEKVRFMNDGQLLLEMGMGRRAYRASHL
jgi:hypothetical protein